MGVYTSAWSTYKARRNAALAAFVCELILFVAIFFLTTHTREYEGAVAALFAMAATNMYFSYRWTAWPCPKCGKSFFGGGRVNPIASITLSAMVKNCRRCGFAKSEIIAGS
ncbi:MAG: hypothetical protein WAM91_13200 [Candidatus Acidiferrales bacterium]